MQLRPVTLNPIRVAIETRCPSPLPAGVCASECFLSKIKSEGYRTKAAPVYFAFIETVHMQYRVSVSSSMPKSSLDIPGLARMYSKLI
jgi:hypothetical protein